MLNNKLRERTKKHLREVYNNRIDDTQFYMKYIIKKDPGLLMDSYDEIYDYIVIYCQYRSKSR